MQIIIRVILLVFTNMPFFIYSQNRPSIEDFGVRHLEIIFQKDTVDIIIKSKKGDEQKQKPIFLFCQGSLPIPLLKYDKKGNYGITPFNTDLICEDFHLIIIGKPNIPLLSSKENLGKNSTYLDKNGKFPTEYSNKNLLDYYVKRNKFILNFLIKQKWVSNRKLVVAGHSEGSTIAAKLTEIYPKITHLIYASGNPMGRIMSMINQNRAIESDSLKLAEDEIKYWEHVVNDKDNLNDDFGDTNKASYQFSNPPIQYLEKIKIPILISYGTKDWCAPFIDFMRVDFIRKHKTNFTYNPYIGLEHNFFPLLENGKPNYAIFNWDKVANDWINWLKTN
ncbi:S9 family peptidase [Flavobacterium sp. 316]|uniref:alpha/beta hydrolase family protein n=1 Tax=Flavobacterium sp. 316 TaxID=1603293 RepID=UPI000699125A|nr:acyl-CoA thioester hydrolase/BAAT C-terminal domain-containing protein [Flavobacterium sp. 316]